MDELIERICTLQSPGGAYLSSVRMPWGDVEDLNCFVTALVLRETAGIEGGARLDDSRRRAQGFLLRSASLVYRYAFAFYPHDRHAYWMERALYPDADDTSVAMLTLVRDEKQPREALAYVAEQYLLKYRSVGGLARHIRHPWQREGAFLTWFTTKEIDNPIDCCVNTNVVALLAYAGLTSMDGYAEACAMINDAAARVAEGRTALSAATPFYPHPLEWLRALEYAISVGGDALTPAWDAVAALQQAADDDRAEPLPLCSSADGRIVWRAEVLCHARRLRRWVAEMKERKNDGRNA